MLQLHQAGLLGLVGLLGSLGIVNAQAVPVAASKHMFVMKAEGSQDRVERYDPILAPNKIGQHCHDVFGANANTLSLDSATLGARAGSEAGCTTAVTNDGSAMVVDDGSLYWHPVCLPTTRRLSS